MDETRATELEFLDREEFNRDAAASSYQLMERVNRHFGGLYVVQRFIETAARTWPKDRAMRILDIGSGTCDIPLAIQKWARKAGLRLHITCLEKCDVAIDLASRRLSSERCHNIEIVRGDICEYEPVIAYDFAITSMCFHHFTDEQIVGILSRMRSLVRYGVLINDLRRSLLALLVVRLLLIKEPPKVRHDALLSIRRGFRKKELQILLSRIEPATFSIHRCRWFRIAAEMRFRSWQDI